MDKPLNRKIIRSMRKTISLEITREQVLIIRAPVFLSERDIDYIVNRHEDWIRKKLSHIRSLPRFRRKSFTYGEKFFYLGKQYELKILGSDERKFYFDGRYFYLSAFARNNAREFFVNWYKSESLHILLPILKSYSKGCSVSYKDVRITSANRRWGSCSKTSRLNFSYRIAMLPLQIINYIAVHELCHIVEHNHSKSFWKKVKIVLPNYREADRWLKKNEYLFNI